MSLFLDSGAFSAFTKKVEINIDEYIAFIKEHSDYIDIYANLDVIGNAEATYENQKYMESKGLKPLPTYHLTSDKKWLKLYADNYEYLAIGGLAAKLLTGPELLKELDLIFSEYICGPDGFPRLKTHGFGLTSVDLLIRYPWYSADSTSWVLCSRFGSAFVPAIRNGKYDYHVTPMKINFSTRGTKPDKYNYYNGITPLLKKQVDKYLEFKNYKIGKSEFNEAGEEVVVEEGLCNHYRHRDIANIEYFQDLEKAMPEWPWKLTLSKQAKGFF